MPHKRKNVVFEYFQAFVIALLVALFLRTFVIQAFRIPTGSMKDTLLIGDFLLVNKFIYGAKTPERIPLTNVKIPSIRLPALKKPERGEVIVFKYPLEEKLDYIKRCVGVPGDTIVVRNGQVFVNGMPEGKESLVKAGEYDKTEGIYVNYYRIVLPSGRDYTIRKRNDIRHVNGEYGPAVVPPGHLFMMGDNRDNSQDSRYWGFLPRENVVGKALMIYWSWDNTVPIWKIDSKIRWSRILDVIH